jgi:hypothetical protein
VDWTVAEGRPLPANRLPADQRNERVRDRGPEEEVPRRTGDEGQIELRGRTLASRIHGATLLLVIVVVQLAWLTTLGYALLRLVA